MSDFTSVDYTVMKKREIMEYIERLRQSYNAMHERKGDLQSRKQLSRMKKHDLVFLLRYIIETMDKNNAPISQAAVQEIPAPKHTSQPELSDEESEEDSESEYETDVESDEDDVVDPAPSTPLLYLGLLVSVGAVAYAFWPSWLWPKRPPQPIKEEKEPVPLTVSV